MPSKRISRGTVLRSRKSGRRHEVAGFAERKTKLRLRDESGHERRVDNDPAKLSKTYVLD